MSQMSLKLSQIGADINQDKTKILQGYRKNTIEQTKKRIVAYFVRCFTKYVDVGKSNCGGNLM